MKAVVCPICNSSGKQYNVPKGITWTGKPNEGWAVNCHGCHGKGWVEVHDDIFLGKDKLMRQI